MNAPSKNPYTPGYDHIPPVLAGRDSERRRLKEIVDALASDGTAATDLIIYGPRGNGKTALLNHLHDELKQNSNVVSIIVVSSELKTAEDLYQVLLGEPISLQQTKSTSFQAKVGLSGTGVQTEHGTELLFEHGTADFIKHCIAVMHKRPTLLIVDEAHRMAQKPFDAILSLARASKRGETKFGFVLSGTPGLPGHLRDMGSTYLNRAPRMRIERLNAEATRTALFSPLKQGEYTVELNEAQETRLIECTQFYPHFIQCVGHAVWDSAQATGKRKVDFEVVQSAETVWQERIDEMYADRLEELSEQELMPYAVNIARLFRENGQNDKIGEEVINRVLHEQGAGEKRMQVTKALFDLGFLWRSSGGLLRYEAAIPSLMDHVLRNAQDGDTN